MSRKIHLRSNTTKNGKAAIALCASIASNGKIKFNNRSTYRYMASEIVGYDEFKNVASAERCSHCCDALPAFNKKRIAAGYREWTLQNN